MKLNWTKIGEVLTFTLILIFMVFFGIVGSLFIPIDCEECHQQEFLEHGP